MASSAQPRFWGYIHVDGSQHLKVLFSGEDIVEAVLSDFVHRTFGPGSQDQVKKEMADYLINPPEVPKLLQIVIKEEVSKLERSHI